MVKEIIMPKLGETMEVGYLVKWFKKEGEKVEKGEPIFEVMSDKTNFEVEATQSGILRKIVVPASENPIPVTAVVGYLADSMEEPLPQVKGLSAEEKTSSFSPSTPEEAVPEQIRERKREGGQELILASPLAKRRAREFGVDLATVKGTGPGGRITEEDVLRASSSRREEVPLKPTGKVLKKGLSPLRQIIADRLSKSKSEIPHYYLRKVLDATGLVNLRADLQKRDPEITYTDILIKVVATGLLEFPELNATYERGELFVYLEEVNIGIAVAREEGLIVPVLKGANHKNYTEIKQERKRLVTAAREEKISKDDLTGGTFTISNLGIFQIDTFYPIIYQPQVAIMGVSAIREGVVADKGRVVVKPLIEITLACDHRVVDGSYSARFLQRLQELFDAIS